MTSDSVFDNIMELLLNLFRGVVNGIVIKSSFSEILQYLWVKVYDYLGFASK